MMGALAEAYHFTPTEMYRLTLAQIAAYGRWISERGDTAPSGRGDSSHSVDTLDDLIMQFGSPESKDALMKGTLHV